MEKQRCRVDFLDLIFFGNFGNFRELENSTRLQWRCGHHLASMLMFGGRTRQPPKLTKQNKMGNTFADFQTGLQFSIGFFWGVKNSFNLNLRIRNVGTLKKPRYKTTKKQPPHLAVFSSSVQHKFSPMTSRGPSPWSRLQLGASMHLLLIG